MSRLSMRKYGMENLHKSFSFRGRLMRSPSFFRTTKMKNKIYRFERWLDRYNHIMELLRTIIPIITLILQIFIIVNLLN